MTEEEGGIELWALAARACVPSACRYICAVYSMRLYPNFFYTIAPVCRIRVCTLVLFM